MLHQAAGASCTSCFFSVEADDYHTETCMLTVRTEQTRSHLTSAGLGFANLHWLCAPQEQMGLDMVTKCPIPASLLPNTAEFLRCCPLVFRLQAPVSSAHALEGSLSTAALSSCDAPGRVSAPFLCVC